MKNIFNKIAFSLSMTAVLMTGCKKEEVEIIPSELSSVTATSTPGRIVLRWDSITDHESIRYVRVTYFDHLTERSTMRTASVYSDSMEIPNTLKKFGDYIFTVNTVSPTDTYSQDTRISKTSEPAPVVYVDLEATPITLTVEDLSSNAPESSEGPISNLLDGNTATFFHTSWSQSIPGPHDLKIALPEVIKANQGLSFSYSPRNNGSNKPTNFDLMGSMDGETWTLIKNFTKDNDGLPVTATDPYNSPTIVLTQDIQHLKFSVNATNSGSIFWTMSEFSINYIERKITDPEAE